MVRTLALLSLATGFATSLGCVLVTDDDGSTANDSNADDGQNTSTAGDDGVDTAMADTAAADTAAADTAAADTAAADEAAADSTGAAGLCGWGPVAEAEVMEGYVCGGMGEDPGGMIPIDCPDIELTVGAECGTIMGEGCCMGDTVWFCANGIDGNPDTLASEACN